MRSLKSILLPLVAAAIALSWSTPSWALIIDSFDNGLIGPAPPPPPGGLIVGLPSGSSLTSVEAAVAGTISGNRTAKVTYVSGSEDNYAYMRISGPPASRYLNMSSDGGVVATWNLDYLSISPAIDLTEGATHTDIDLLFLKADHDFKVKVSLDTSVGLLTQTLSFGAIASPTTFNVPFASFLNGSNVVTPVTPSTPVSGVHVEIQGTDSGQYQLDFIETYGDPTPTPEPSTFALAGIGLASLSWIGWRRRSRAAA